MTKYEIQVRECGIGIEEFSTLEEAEEVLAEYHAADIADGIEQPKLNDLSYYEIVAK